MPSETPKIQKLAQQVVNQIAAGEVVERPASAIKELVDNGIDAGASSIQIQVLSADGRSFRVIDNGHGINPAELELAFAPHATSKIQEVADLDNLLTLGFRGEALASIASIAQVICISKYVEADQARKVTFNEDKIPQISLAAFSQGTSLEVRDLFYNVPARLKFLKRPEAELGLIHDVVQELALANPGVAFELQSKNKTTLKTSGSGDMHKAIQELFSQDLTFKYLELTKENDENIHENLTVQGWLAPLSACRSDRRNLVVLVNNRPIKCETVYKAVRSVFKPFLPPGKYPQLVLHLNLLPKMVDFNVHPTKREVRYAKPQLVYQTVQAALEKHLVLNATASLQNTFPENDSEKALVANAWSELNQAAEEQSTGNSSNKPFSQQLPGSYTQSLGESSFESSCDSGNVSLFALGELKERANAGKVIVGKAPDNSLAPDLADLDRKINKLFPEELSRDGSHQSSFGEHKTEIKKSQIALNISSLKLEFKPLETDSFTVNSPQSIKSERGNSTDFSICSNSAESTKLASNITGQLVGEKWLRDKFLVMLQSFVDEATEQASQNTEITTQLGIVDSANLAKSLSRPRAPIKLLEQVWEKDNWRCVYCGKHLLHPGLVKRALPQDSTSWVSRLTAGNKLLKTHILREHQASFDHLLPYKHNSSFAVQIDNLFACCRACNQTKSSSTNLQKWRPRKFSTWAVSSPGADREAKQKIGNLFFSGGDLNAAFEKLD